MIAALLWLLVIVCLFLTIAKPWDRHISLLWGSGFLIFAAVSSLAVVGLSQRWGSRRKFNLLKFYIIVQLLLDAFIFVLKLANIIDIEQLSAVGNWLVLLAWLALLNLPLILIVGNGKWFPKLDPQPPTNASGKYLNRIACNYDLCGSSGQTRPECGAPIMASDADPSMLND